MRIGVDVGGTFTDVVMVDDGTGDYFYGKTPTTYPDLWLGVLSGIEKVLAEARVGISAVDYIVHGTTIGTNALLERKGVPVGLITSEGFGDVLEIGRVQRPPEGLYNFFIDNPPPLVPRQWRRAVAERVDYRGRVLTPLDEAAVRREARYLKAKGVASIAVCFLFSFLNPAHERRAAAIIHEEFPEAYVSLSSEVAPEFREYERTNTTVVNAYLQPIMKRYLERLTAELQRRYGEVDLRIMQASGGTMTVTEAQTMAVHTVNSGPAGGALASAFSGQLLRRPRTIGVDMGGTSFDICVIEDGVPRTTTEAKFEGLPLKVPMLEVDTIGAGGGSIAWIDVGGALNVGPKSAGSQPGPACYGRGGTLPTVTDANLVLGRLNPDYFVGGEMSLDLARAHRAIVDHVAVPLGMSAEEAAAGIIRVVNAKMAKGISTNSVEKGHDVREFALIAFGGAGPLHAVELAQDLGITTVVVPPLCGNLSAFGLLVADARHDYVRTLMARTDTLDVAACTAAFRAMEEEGIGRLERARFRREDVGVTWSVDMRYQGQGFELNVPVDRKDLTAEDIAVVVERFAELHHQRFAYTSAGETAQFVNLRVTCVGRTPEVRLRRQPLTRDTAVAPKTTRPVWFAGAGLRPVAIYDREQLLPGAAVDGPCIVEEKISALVVPPGWQLYSDGFGNLVVTSSRQG